MNRTTKTIRTIATYEALKGFIALLALIGLIDLLHHDLRHIALSLIGHFDWDAHAPYPSLLLHWADVLSDVRRGTIIFLASAYVTLRFVEAYGLWFERRWAEWLAALSGGVYLPFEVFHLWHSLSVVNILVLLSNALMVGYLVWRLIKTREKQP
jgi:uncharacterized membrane protein (DUF2068 family)